MSSSSSERTWHWRLHILVDVDDAAGGALATAVHSVVYNLLAFWSTRGISPEQWNCRADRNVDALREGWTAKHSDNDMIPANILQIVIEVPGILSLNNGGSRLSQCQKSDIALLEAIAEGEWRPLTESDEMNASTLSQRNAAQPNGGTRSAYDPKVTVEHLYEEVPFQLLDINGKERVRQLLRFRPKKRKLRWQSMTVAGVSANNHATAGSSGVDDTVREGHAEGEKVPDTPETACTLFGRSFPSGYNIIENDGFAPRCGFFAIRDSMRNQSGEMAEILDIEDLLTIAREGRAAAILRESGWTENLESNFSYDHLAMILCEWGTERGREIQLGLYVRNERPRIFSTTSISADVTTIWIEHDRVNLYSGMRKEAGDYPSTDEDPSADEDNAHKADTTESSKEVEAYAPGKEANETSNLSKEQRRQEKRGTS
ncbi:hypothetical protein DL762_008918 [Monosporascus cannonballus]|uniref:Uncharacterized protein n=1 Tax=Monosporascus cannonballus TaxID=155416 RepID=A0ABY0GVI8_9PEZI|nr:hypothetical protein DL762_008918 [Monosporascus cannonballus]